MARTYVNTTRFIDPKAFYRTMHCTLNSYMIENQGMLCLPDWIGLIKNKDGSPLHHWNHREGSSLSPSILEVGCGNGLLCKHLSLFASVTGIDITDSPARHEGRMDYKFIERDVAREELPANQYDYILSFDVLEHLGGEGIFHIIDQMQGVGKELLIKVACSGIPPLHITVQPPNWWLKTLMLYAPNHNWSIIRNYRRHDEKGNVIFAPLFYGRKEK